MATLSQCSLFQLREKSDREPQGSPSSSEPPKLTPCRHHSSSQSPLPTPVSILYTSAHKLTPIHPINRLPILLCPSHKLLSPCPQHQSLLRSPASSFFSSSESISIYSLLWFVILAKCQNQCCDLLNISGMAGLVIQLTNY